MGASGVTGNRGESLQCALLTKEFVSLGESLHLAWYRVSGFVLAVPGRDHHHALCSLSIFIMIPCSVQDSAHFDMASQHGQCNIM